MVRGVQFLLILINSQWVKDLLLLFFSRVNDVQKFRFSRPFHRRMSADEGICEENEFATLWLERTVLVTSYPLPGILRWFPVTATDTFQISPLRNAIETMETSNKLVLSYLC